MKRRIALAGAALAVAAGTAFYVTQPAQAATGLHVSGTSILEANGNPFIIRGTSHAHTWYTSQTTSFANIKSLGANTVRVVLSGGRWTANGSADVANVVSLCKTNRLVCVLENHDTTGYGEQNGAYTLDQAVTYWKSLKSTLAGTENYIIINIGNEPFGNYQGSKWAGATGSAIKAMRDAGFEHALMVDAPDWGQDWSGTMRQEAKTVAAADPNANTIFSVHMYGVYDTADEVTSYVAAFKAAGLPLVIGEFGHNHSDGNPDEDTIMATAVAEKVGYMGWSWSGNSSDVAYLDQAVNFDPATLSDWGKRLFNGANGIKATAKEATFFKGQTGSPTSPTTPPSTPPSTAPSSSTPTSPTSPTQGRGCTAAYAVIGSWPGGFQGEVKVTAGTSAINGWTVTWTYANGQTVTQAWNATVTSSGTTVTATNLGYNGKLAAASSASFGFTGSWNGTNTAPSLTCTAS